jgi:hypothetical protein
MPNAVALTCNMGKWGVKSNLTKSHHAAVGRTSKTYELLVFFGVRGIRKYQFSIGYCYTPNRAIVTKMGSLESRDFKFSF